MRPRIRTTLHTRYKPSRLRAWAILNKMTGIDLIAKERQEQMTKHGWTPMHDDEHKEEQLTGAALCALTEDEEYWPNDWDDSYLIKIAAKDYKERLIVAGALIAAELDRLERAGG